MVAVPDIARRARVSSHESGLAWPAFVHPWSALALALLVLNDHVLKASGWVPAITGKLSDFAGLFFFPLLAVAMVSAGRELLGRSGLVTRRALAVSCVGTAAWFTALQTLPFVAQAWLDVSAAVAPWLGGVPSVTMDPLDLVALPMCAVAYLHGARWSAQ